jgi:hypothetical protein
MSHCCDLMRTQVQHVCRSCADLAKTCPDQLVAYNAVFHEYGLLIHDGEQSQSKVRIDFCPWCGAVLPDSLRHQWFDELERRGIDDPLDAPEDMRDGSWTRSAGSPP